MPVVDLKLGPLVGSLNLRLKHTTTAITVALAGCCVALKVSPTGGLAYYM